MDRSSDEPGKFPPDHLNLVRHATLAASSHNTQPWKFRREHSAITILPDWSRRCPVVDPDDHHLYASLGCAAENLLLAAQATGLKGHLSCDAVESGIRVDFEEMKPSPSGLSDAIPRRQCSRTEYDGTTLDAGQLRLLEEAGHGNEAGVRLLTDRSQIGQVAEYVAAGNTVQFAGFLGLGHRRPDLVIRIGHGPEMPRSRRRPVESVLA